MTARWRQPALLPGAPELELVDVDPHGWGQLVPVDGSPAAEADASAQARGDVSSEPGDDRSPVDVGDASVQVLGDPSAPTSGHASPACRSDPSALPARDASPPAAADGRACAWCRVPLVDVRLELANTRFCSKGCRQASWKFGRRVERLRVAEQPKRLAFADPPYPGLSRRYYGDHPDYGGEVDHGELLAKLVTYDGWALSTSARALPLVLGLAHAVEPRARVAAWVRGERRVPSSGPLASWEPVIYVPARNVPRLDQPADSLVCTPAPYRSDPARVIGAKPAAFSSWLFALLGAQAGDDLADLFPGSGAVTRAWETAAMLSKSAF